MLNKVILMGRLCADPELRQTQSGVSVCRFRIAVNRQYADKRTGERQADFISCEAWNKTAEFIGEYFQKGSMILVEGSLRNDDYTDQNGVKRYAMKVLTNHVNFGETKAAQRQQNAPQQAQNGYPQSYGTSPDVPYTAAQSTPRQAAMLGNLNDFEEILSDGEPPF